MNQGDVDRFDRRVDRSGGPDACHPWRWDGRPPRGPAVHRVSGRGHVQARRFALELALGRHLRPGTWAASTCGNDACCNPRHLYEAS